MHDCVFRSSRCLTIVDICSHALLCDQTFVHMHYCVTRHLFTCIIVCSDICSHALLCVQTFVHMDYCVFRSSSTRRRFRTSPPRPATRPHSRTCYRRWGIFMHSLNTLLQTVIQSPVSCVYTCPALCLALANKCKIKQYSLTIGSSIF